MLLPAVAAAVDVADAVVVAAGAVDAAAEVVAADVAVDGDAGVVGVVLGGAAAAAGVLTRWASPGTALQTYLQGVSSLGAPGTVTFGHGDPALWTWRSPAAVYAPRRGLSGGRGGPPAGFASGGGVAVGRVVPRRVLGHDRRLHGIGMLVAWRPCHLRETWAARRSRGRSRASWDLCRCRPWLSAPSCTSCGDSGTIF